MEYNITDFDHEQGTFVVLYSDGAYINFMAPRKDGVYSSGLVLENYIQWRHPSVKKDHVKDVEPLLVDEKPDTNLPDEIIQKAASYQSQITSSNT